MNPVLAGALERGDIRRGDAFAVAPAPTLASGFPRLDAELPGGGWPRGALTELLAEHEGIGELGLLLPALAACGTGAAQVQRAHVGNVEHVGITAHGMVNLRLIAAR